MMPGSKIATCCYCGTRAALVLDGTARHELRCGTCGAPLHDLKAIPARKVAQPDIGPGRETPKKPGKSKSKGSGRDLHARLPRGRSPDGHDLPSMSTRVLRQGMRRKRGSRTTRRLISGAFDLLEDLLD